MSKQANPTLVGSFILGAILLAVLALLLLGGGKAFENSFECVVYFDESISGLDVGAPVDFQGVRIGSVTDVKLVYDGAADSLIVRPVRLAIEESRIELANDQSWGRDVARNMEGLVANQGLRARLATQSLLTGKLKIELGLFPEQPIRRRNRDASHWEMPSIPSPLQAVADEVAQLPISAIVHDAHRAIQRIADMMDPERSAQTIDNLNRTLANLETLLSQVSSKIDPIADQGTGFLQTAQASLDDLRGLLRQIDANMPPLVANLTSISGNVDALTDPESHLREEISRLLEELRATSQSIRYLANQIEEQPESLLRGKK